jgi:hypothetical protein
MARTHLILGGLTAALMSLSAPAIAEPGGLATATPATHNQTTLVRGGWGHGGGGWGHGGWHGGYGHRRGYPYFAYWGGYPYFNDYYYDDYGYDYGYDTCYYSRRLRARVCPEY